MYETFNYIVDRLKDKTPTKVYCIFWNNGQSIESRLTFDRVPGLTTACSFEPSSEYQSMLECPIAFKSVRLVVEKKSIELSVSTTSANDIEHHLHALLTIVPSATSFVRAESLKRDLTEITRELDSAQRLLADTQGFKTRGLHT